MLFKYGISIDLAGVEPEEHIGYFRSEDEAYEFAREQALHMLDEYDVESYSLDEAAIELFDKPYDNLDLKQQNAVDDFIDEKNEQCIEYWVEPADREEWQKQAQEMKEEM